MSIRKLVLALALGTAGLCAVHAPNASARVVVGVHVGLPVHAPPPLRVERVVVRPGHVWIPGYWRWSDARYVWVGGYSARPRPGYRWHAASWTGCGPNWCYHKGYWAR
jgi:hypothetical protein